MPITSSPPNPGSQASRAIDDALRRADVNPSDLCGVQAHATGTSSAIWRKPGPCGAASAVLLITCRSVPKRPAWPPAGGRAVETILALQALRHGVMPRSHNADPLDPEVSWR